MVEGMFRIYANKPCAVDSNFRIDYSSPNEASVPHSDISLYYNAPAAVSPGC